MCAMEVRKQVIASAMHGGVAVIQIAPARAGMLSATFDPTHREAPFSPLLDRLAREGGRLSEL